MNTQLTITFRILSSGNLCGIMDVQMKAPLTEETYQEMCHLLETRLHYLLTHTHQEGGMGEEHTFCATSFQHVLRAVEEVGGLFGEDATVILDRNMAFYRADGMENLFGKELELTVGAPQRGGEGRGEQWDFVPLANGWRQLLA